MVFVYSNTLSIDPIDPYTTDSIHVSAWIGGDAVQLYCPGGGTPLWGFTRTYIHLMRRNLDLGQTRAQATHISQYDCYTQCCLDDMNWTEVPGHPGSKGWQIGFDIINPISSPGKYEFFAVDDEDYKKTSYAADRIGALTFEVTRDPEQIIETPIITTDETTCDEGDILCQYADYLPYIAIGGVILLILMSSKRGHH